MLESRTRNTPCRWPCNSATASCRLNRPQYQLLRSSESKLPAMASSAAYTLGRRRRRRARPSCPGARRPADRLRSQPHSSARNGGGGRGPSPPEMTRTLPPRGCREGDRNPPLGEGQRTPRARTAHAFSRASPPGRDRNCRG